MRKRGVIVLLLAISFCVAAFFRSDDLRFGLLWGARMMTLLGLSISLLDFVIWLQRRKSHD